MKLQSTITALMKASGISLNQAKTAAYYAVATYINSEKQPILVILGKAGTGKSSLMEQLTKLVKQPKWVNARTSAALRTELSRPECFTVFIEEGDNIDEDLIANRYSKETAQIAVRVEGEKGWHNVSANVFGATIIHRRRPMSDVAIRSRSIVIRTDYNEGNYRIVEIGNEEVSEAAGLITKIHETSHRVEDTWAPLVAVAEALDDQEWLSHAKERIEQDKVALVGGHSYEPDEALTYALRALMVPDGNTAVQVRVSNVKKHLQEHYDLKMKSYQIEQMLTDMGFTVAHPQGYPTIKPNLELLKDLIVKAYKPVRF